MAQRRVGQQQEALVQQIVAQSFSGPLPAPEMLQGYEDVVPGAAARILTLAEEEALHRRGLDRSFVRYRTASLMAATLIALAALLGGIYLAATGHSTGGLAVIITEITALVVVYLVNQFRPR